MSVRFRHVAQPGDGPWNRFNLTTNLNANVQISLWGYREATIRPELEFIDMIETQLTNTGAYTIIPANYRMRDNPRTVDMQFGFIQINLTNPEQSAIPVIDKTTPKAVGHPGHP